MKNSLILCLPALFCASASLGADFTKDIVPILKSECYKCHSEEAGKEKGDFVFDNLKRFAKDVGPGRAIEPGKPEESRFFETLTSHVDDDGHMPPKKSLSAPQIAKFKEWITAGAAFDGSGAPATAAAGASSAPPASAPAAASSLPEAPVMQNWTNTEGRAIQAAMLRMEGENVVLRMANGQIYNYPMSKLSPDSQELAKKGGK